MDHTDNFAELGSRLCTMVVKIAQHFQKWCVSIRYLVKVLFPLQYS